MIPPNLRLSQLGAWSAVPTVLHAAQETPRIIVLTDISNEPDDEQSLIRLLLYSNEINIEGLIACTSTWLRTQPREDLIRDNLRAYGQVRAKLLLHSPSYPCQDALEAVTCSGQPGYSLESVGEGKSSPGSRLILQALGREDPRPLWLCLWGGANTLAQALSDARRESTPSQLEALVAKLRVYAISDQDHAGPWLRREFPELFYVKTLFNMEGDTPSYFWLINNGLGGHLSPSFGGWGGRYVLYQAYGETRPIWTNHRDSRDTVVAENGRIYTSDQATIWRWREHYQNDFAARMDWCVQPYAKANHKPVAVLNADESEAVLLLKAPPGSCVELNSAGSRDPDGGTVKALWWIYREVSTGNPDTQLDKMFGPVTQLRLDADAAAGQEFHVILDIEDSGTPPLHSYRRAIIQVS